MTEIKLETVADLKTEIIRRGKLGQPKDKCLTAFIEGYGKCGEYYDEEEWLMKCGTFVSGWISANSAANAPRGEGTVVE